MKFNLKNRPKIIGQESGVDEFWFKSLEKELRKMRKDYKKHGIGDPVVDMLFKEILGE